MDKLNELGTPQKLIAGGGILLLVASFLPWYKVSLSFGDLGGLSFTANGWQAPGALFSILAVLAGIVLVGSILGPLFSDMKLPDLGSVSWIQARLGLGGGALALVIIKFLSESSSLSYGFYLGLIAAAAMAAGSYMLYQEDKDKDKDKG